MLRPLIPLMALIAALVPPGSGHAATAPTEVRLLVRAETDQAVTAVERAGARFEDRPAVYGWRIAIVRTQQTPDEAAIQLGRATGLAVLPDPELTLFNPAAEPMYPSQWYLTNQGQTGGSPGADIEAPVAWELTTGGVTVAVIDSGVQLGHLDLAQRIWSNPDEMAGNGIDDDGNGLVDDVNGWDFVDYDADPSPGAIVQEEAHGTMVAGALGATVNGFGITGVAPLTRIMVVRACSETRPDGCSTFNLAEAVQYAINEGAKIINLSLGGYVADADLAYDPLVIALDQARAAGVLVVAAAGNSAADISTGSGATLIPAALSYPNIISVAATTSDDNLATFSNWSATAVDVGAPGQEILTTTLTELGSYATVNGTSFSAPITAGAASLMMALNPDLTAEQTIRLLGSLSDPLPALAGRTVYGGRVNAGNAVYAARYRDTIDSIFLPDVVWLSRRGITRGCTPAGDQYCPNGTVTRGQMAAFLNRTFVLPAATTDHFDDDQGSIFEDDINRVAEAGITLGCGERTYCPDAGVTRGAMAAFLSRALGLTDSGTVQFVDIAGSGFETEIAQIATAGITRGCNPTGDRFCPNDPVTRGQMAAFLHRGVG